MEFSLILLRLRLVRNIGIEGLVVIFKLNEKIEIRIIKP